MDLLELQSQAAVWRHNNFPPSTRTPLHQLAGVTEEVGELAHALLKMSQGIRGDEEKHRLDAEDAMGDIVIYLTGIADHLHVDLEDCVTEAWGRVKERDWNAYPETGLPQ
jgi:NTP pyrophosphatase (non-canonical NTP hydrolase)